MPEVKCPTCKKVIDFYISKWRPFCSERCEMIDLGKWIYEGYTIPGREEKDET